jgi:hypothetical protein
MNIDLERFSLDREQYFRILLRNYFARRWWLLILDAVLLGLFIVALIYIPEALQLIHYVGVGIVIFFPVVYVVRFHRYAHAGNNDALFMERTAAMDDDGLSVHFDDGGTDTIPWNQVVRVIEEKEYFLIYVSRQQFVFVSKGAFPSHKAAAEFREFARRNRWFKRFGFR